VSVETKYLWFRALTGLLETPADGSTSADLSATGEDTPEVIIREIRDQRQEIQTALGFRSLSVLRYSYFNKWELASKVGCYDSRCEKNLQITI
jgi:hypothetical protein